MTGEPGDGSKAPVVPACGAAGAPAAEGAGGARRDRLLLLLAAVAIAGVVVHGAFWFLPLDDAYITFRYARNVARGLGPVYNPGERVEGYSCPLWLALMLPAPALGLDYLDWATVLTYAPFLAGVAVLFGVLRREEPACPLVAGVVLTLLLVGNPQSAMLLTSGMEPLLSAALLAGVLACGGRGGWGAAVLLTLAAWNRPEGIIYVAPAAAYLFWRRRPVAAVVLLPALGWGLSRVAARAYHGSWLPNTFYAKVGSTWAQAARGLEYVFTYFGATATGIACTVGLAAFALVSWRGRSGAAARLADVGGPRLPSGDVPDGVALGWLLGAAHVGFLVAVGGGIAFAYRHLAPAFLVLSYAAAWSLGRAALLLLPRRRVVAGVALASLAYVAGLASQWEGLKQIEAQHLYVHFGRVAVGEWLAATCPPGTLVAANAIGVVGFESDLALLDLLGLVDPVVARTPNVRMGSGVAGHERYNVDYVLRRRPALILPRGIVLTPAPSTWAALSNSFVEGDRVLLADPRVKEAYDLRSTAVRPGRFLNYLEAKSPRQGPASARPPSP